MEYELVPGVLIYQLGTKWVIINRFNDYLSYDGMWVSSHRSALPRLVCFDTYEDAKTALAMAEFKGGCDV